MKINLYKKTWKDTHKKNYEVFAVSAGYIYSKPSSNMRVKFLENGA